MSLVSDIVAELRAQVAALVAVGGAADLERLDDDQVRVGLPKPFALVLPRSDTPVPDADEGLQLIFSEEIAVILGVDNTGDPQGQAAADALEPIKLAVMDALNAWEPPSIPQGSPGTRWRLAFAGGRPLQIDAATFYWEMDFTTRHSR